MLIQFDRLEKSDLFRSGVVYFVQLQFQIFISQPRKGDWKWDEMGAQLPGNVRTKHIMT